MRDGTAEDWEALARLTTGEGSKADFELLARDFREHHLDPAQISMAAMLWVDICLKRMLDGEQPAAVFKQRPARGRPQQYTTAFKAFATLRYLQEKRAHGTEAARAVILREFSRSDWRNFERDILQGNFGSTWTDEEIARRIEIFRSKPRVVNQG